MWSFIYCADYLFNKDFGILGSSANHNMQALVPKLEDNEPIQDNNDANILYLLYFLFHINYKKHHSFYSYYMVIETSYKLKGESSK